MTEGVAEGVRLLAGRYHIGDLVGRGGMADVRAGTDTRLGRRVAIKLLKPSLARDPAFRSRFRREAQDAAKMAHPTIVRVYDAGEETVLDPNGDAAQIPFIVMEYVDGRLLKDIVAEGPLEPKEAVRIIEQVLTALEYSHRAGVVHRDVKPGNIMIADNGQVKVMDFGIARAISESSATLAETSKIVGTAQYFSPEQARGEAVDARTDLYSAGVVLFELLTGMAPFRGVNPVAVAYQHVNQIPVVPSTINSKVSPALDAVVLRALSKDRFARFQSAGEFREDLQAAARGTVPARRPAPENDWSATLFGVNPHATAEADATIRRLSVDREARAVTQPRPPAAWIWAGVAVMAVVLFAVVYWTINLPKQAAISNSLSVTVPNVAGDTWGDAARILKTARLEPQKLAEISSAVRPGQVIRTDPGSGERVGPQQPVKVYVSLGRNPTTVPSLSGLPLDKARATLTASRLTLGDLTRKDSPSIARDVVISSTPGGGSGGLEGDPVDLQVSTGMVDVPSVVGKTSQEAGSQLSTLELPIKVITDGGCSGKTVTSQSLPPGLQPQKSPISITVCTG